ncbi:endonuclease IV [Capsaspora owczarzaki ATCC 30864]|uniref:Endonuclease IV n=1 Tax=Capsaspora owczarzaki (strain ATCC 30864) TaxID=595528 RepID=A0A0D2WQD8_CAPO3|nr:endonuclease IV [Capsaspora owczarzaki ATCC 30864]KJE93875.1 endonuclease IV [Capsaspora owczarzaki ATCC 30864]|eukprot:XP_004347342.1 endonuclease IV [Capsaspora owczarzaki ATCC 30864]
MQSLTRRSARLLASSATAIHAAPATHNTPSKSESPLVQSTRAESRVASSPRSKRTHSQATEPSAAAAAAVPSPSHSIAAEAQSTEQAASSSSSAPSSRSKRARIQEPAEQGSAPTPTTAAAKPTVARRARTNKSTSNDSSSNSTIASVKVEAADQAIPAAGSSPSGIGSLPLSTLSTTVSRLVGYHVSTAGGVQNAPVNAALVGATAFAMDTRSKRKWDSPPYTAATIQAFRKACCEHGYQPHQILPHGSYLINAGSPVPEILAKSRAALIEEVQRCEQLGLSQYNFHPGSTVGLCTTEKCIETIAESIDLAVGASKAVTVVVESMTGSGNVIGGKFEHLRDIIAHVKDKTRIGVCLDTCHMFAAGFDLRTRAEYDKVMNDFDRIVGFQYLRGLHLNDSKGELGCNRDRHENIGKGKLGLSAFELIMNDERFRNIPMILETPVSAEVESDGYKKEIELLQSMVRTGK